MNISLLFSTPERVTILRRIIYRIEPFHVSNVARETNLSKALVSKYLSCLKEEGLVQKQEAQYAVREGIKTCLIRILLTLDEVAEFHFESHPIARAPVWNSGPQIARISRERNAMLKTIGIAKVKLQRMMVFKITWTSS